MARFIKDKNNRIFDTEWYGIETLGDSFMQKRIIQKNKKYYFEIWKAGDIDGNIYGNIDGHTEEFEIKVVKASDDIRDLVDKIIVNGLNEEALLDGKVVAVYRDFDDDIFGRPISDWDVLTNYY